MPRGLPWTNHTNATGERPVFYADMVLDHQTVSLGLYDLLPGPVQGRVKRWAPLKYQQRGGQDSIRLSLTNAPSSALGKAIRCQGGGAAAARDGSFAYWLPSSGTPFGTGTDDHAFMVIMRAWSIEDLDSAGAILAFKKNHFRFILKPDGSITLEFDNGGVWSVVTTDAAGLSDGELFSIGFSHAASSGQVTYFRRSDSGDLVGTPARFTPAGASGAHPIVFSGDSDGAIANAGTEGRFPTWLDVDEPRWWSRTLTSSEFQAAARRTLKPSEANDSSLVAWTRFDEGTGTTSAVSSQTGASITATLTADNGDGVFSPALTAPEWISGITRDRITDHMEALYPIEGALVRIWIAFSDPVATTPVKLFEGVVSEVIQADRRSIELDVRDVSERADRLIGTVVDKTTWPDAPESSVGKIIPLVFGSVTDLPGLRLSEAKRTRLRASVLTASTSIPVDDTTGFPTSGTILVDEEQIDYTGTTSDSFTGVTRGANGTIATSHVTGAQVTEVRSEVYAFADHAVTALTNVRKLNSRGEAVPVDAADITIATTPRATVTFTRPPRVDIRGEGSLWLSIGTEEPFTGPPGPGGAINSVFEAEKACELNAAWTETNFGIQSQPGQDFLVVRRTSDFDGPVPASGVLKAYVVYEHHGIDPVTTFPAITASLTQSGVLLLPLGTLVSTNTTPDRALQQGAFFTEAAGFEGAHQHQIPGSLHDHLVGQPELSTIIRPVSGPKQYATPSGWSVSALGVNPYNQPQGTLAPQYTATQFFLRDSLNYTADGSVDTFDAILSSPTPPPTTATGVYSFGNLSRTNRQIKRVRLVAVVSGRADLYEIEFSIRGQAVATIPVGSMSALGNGTSARTTYVSSVVDLTPSQFALVELLRPDSLIRITAPGGQTVSGQELELWEVYVETELDSTAPSTRIVRPTYDNWIKALEGCRDGRIETFEPSTYCAHMTLQNIPGGPSVPSGFNRWLINPNPPVNGPDCPFSTLTQPTLRFYFTDLDEPFARLKSAAIIIAHNNGFDSGPPSLIAPQTVPLNFISPPPPGGFIQSDPGFVIDSTSGAPLSPRYLVRLVLRGVQVAAFDFSLDMSDAVVPVDYDGWASGRWPMQRSFVQELPFTWAQPGPIYFGAGTTLTRGDPRVESSSGWQNLAGLAPGGGDYQVSDLIGNAGDSYIEIIMPPPTPSTNVDAISSEHTNPGSDPNYTVQNPLYHHIGSMWTPRLFDVRIEYYAEEFQDEAQDEDTGPTDAQDALSHSSLTWFDVTSSWLLINSWNAFVDLGVEFAAGPIVAMQDKHVKYLRVNSIIEFGVVGQEDTNRIIADVDSGDGGNPIDHVERIFDDYIGAAYKDSSAFATAKTLARTDAAGVLLEQKKASEVIDSILTQYSFSWFWENGLFVPLFKPALSSISAGSPTLDEDAIVRDSLSISRTPQDEIINDVEVLWGPNYVDGDFTGSTDAKAWTDREQAESATSKTAYSATKKRVVEADWIVTASAALAYRDNILDYLDHAATVLRWSTYLNGLDVVRGDVVDISHEWRSTNKVEVVELSINPGGRDNPPTIEFVGIDRNDAP